MPGYESAVGSKNVELQFANLLGQLMKGEGGVTGEVSHDMP
jgi:hypothetical protein